MTMLTKCHDGVISSVALIFFLIMASFAITET